MTDTAPQAAQQLKPTLDLLRPWLLGISTISFLIYGFLSVPLNLILQLVTYGHPVELAPGVQSSPYDIWTGHYPLAPAWWLFAVSGVLYLVVAIIGYPGYEDSDATLGRIASQFSDDGSLGRSGLVFALLQVVVILTYDGFLSPFDPYAIGPIACLIGAAICYLRWKTHPRPLTKAEARDAKPVTALARVLGAIKAAVIVLVLILGPTWIAANELIYVTSHEGRIPPNNGAAYLTVDELWPGHLPLPEPWQLLAAFSAIYFLVFAVTWPPKNRQATTPARRLLFAATTNFSFIGYGILIALFEIQLGNFSGAPGIAPVAVGPGIAAATVVLAIVRQFVTPEPIDYVTKRRRKPEKEPA